MFTVKLYRTIKGRPLGEDSYFPAKSATKLVEAEEVTVYLLRHDELYHVVGLTPGGRPFAFYVANDEKPRPPGFADDIDFYYAAYIENSAGATTETVKFSPRD
jgi:hypothetical protein